MQSLIHRMAYFVEIFFLSPALFFKKVYMRILFKVVSTPKGAVPIKVGDYTIVTWPARNDWWKLMYIGYSSIEVKQEINRYLTTSGIFIDVGGCVGYLSAIASRIVGSSGQVHCFEPNPVNIASIQKMIQSNPDSNIILNGYALGIDDGVHHYYKKSKKNSTEVTMIENLICPEEVTESFEVKTKRLDKYLEQKNINNVSLIKIDVEGFEYFVLKGLEGYFQKNINRPPIICEITPSAYVHLDYTINELYNYMRDYGYQAYSIFNSNRVVDIRSMHEVTDVVFRALR
ncbi:MAG: FkbM family methyltransferase [Thermodesulfobacteriota bacterium]